MNGSLGMKTGDQEHDGETDAENACGAGGGE